MPGKTGVLAYPPKEGSQQAALRWTFTNLLSGLALCASTPGALSG